MLSGKELTCATYECSEVIQKDAVEVIAGVAVVTVVKETLSFTESDTQIVVVSTIPSVVESVAVGLLVTAASFSIHTSLSTCFPSSSRRFLAFCNKCLSLLVNA